MGLKILSSCKLEVETLKMDRILTQIILEFRELGHEVEIQKQNCTDHRHLHPIYSPRSDGQKVVDAA